MFLDPNMEVLQQLRSGTLLIRIGNELVAYTPDSPLVPYTPRQPIRNRNEENTSRKKDVPPKKPVEKKKDLPPKKPVEKKKEVQPKKTVEKKKDIPPKKSEQQKKDLPSKKPDQKKSTPPEQQKKLVEKNNSTVERIDKVLNKRICASKYPIVSTERLSASRIHEIQRNIEQSGQQSATQSGKPAAAKVDDATLKLLVDSAVNRYLDNMFADLCSVDIPNEEISSSKDDTIVSNSSSDEELKKAIHLSILEARLRNRGYEFGESSQKAKVGRSTDVDNMATLFDAIKITDELCAQMDGASAKVAIPYEPNEDVVSIGKLE